MIVALLAVNANHTLRNVIVRVDGAPPSPPPLAPAIVAQDECAYRPRISAVVAGQAIAVRNLDGTLHNVHSFVGTHSWFNQAQLAGSSDIARTAGNLGELIKLKCDVHPWMTAYVYVHDNGLTAVTDDNGRFRIDGVPPGRWPVVAWHERLGERRANALVTPAAVGSLELVYRE